MHSISLSLSLSLSRVTGLLIEDEQYWEKCCHHRWKLCVPDEYGGNWKRMYFERNIEEMIETFVPQKSDVKEVSTCLLLHVHVTSNITCTCSK